MGIAQCPFFGDDGQPLAYVLNDFVALAPMRVRARRMTSSASASSSTRMRTVTPDASKLYRKRKKYDG